MAKKNIQNEFNASAEKIINEKEFLKILEAEKPKGLSYIIGSAISLAALPVNLAVAPFRSFALHKKWDEDGGPYTQLYVPQEKETAAGKAAFSMRYKPFPAYGAVKEAVGAENVYVDAASLTRVFSEMARVVPLGSKGALKRLEKAVNKAPDYSADVKAGKLILLHLGK